MYTGTSDPERYTAMKEQLTTYTARHQIECRTCADADPDATAKAKETGYWLPWVGSPPDALLRTEEM
jgi:hypothetical protein